MNNKNNIVYETARIYKLVSDSNPDICYIGSTKQKLNRRLNIHKVQYNAYKKGSSGHYVSSFEILNFDDCRIEQIEELENCEKSYLIEREKYHVLNNNCVNLYIPGRTKKESYKIYYMNNLEKIRENQRKYYNINREKIRDRCNKKYKNKKDVNLISLVT